MRARTGTFLNEAHGKALRHYDFVADGSKTPHEITLAAEAATGLRLSAHPLGQHGYINTSLRPDGSRHVLIVLYEDCQNERDCPAGHRGTKHVRTADLSAAQQDAIASAVGEHPVHRLTGDAGDAAVLESIGLGLATHPHLHDPDQA